MLFLLPGSSLPCIAFLIPEADSRLCLSSSFGAKGCFHPSATWPMFSPLICLFPLLPVIPSTTGCSLSPSLHSSACYLSFKAQLQCHPPLSHFPLVPAGSNLLLLSVLRGCYLFLAGVTYHFPNVYRDNLWTSPSSLLGQALSVILTVWPGDESCVFWRQRPASKPGFAAF